MQKLNNKQKKKFFTIVSSVLIIFSILAIIILLGYNFFTEKPSYDPNLQRDASLATEEDIKTMELQTNSKFTAPVRTNFLILGVDKEESLTDVIMVGSFVSTTGEISLLSIPRDTYINYTGEDLKNLRAINKGAPSHMKANSVYVYGKNKGEELLETTLESMLGIKIDYYIKVNLDAFKYIVDSVGGINFEVPKGGLKYSDPTQNLYINLKEGYQLLDGNAAEGLVRFRSGYARADLQRVEVQQEFIKEFVKQVLNKETIVNNIGGIILSAIKYVETDFGISDLPKYLSVIQDINVENINNATLPGIPQTIDGASYYVSDKIKTKEIVDKFFYGNTSKEEEVTSEESSTDNIDNTPTKP